MRKIKVILPEDMFATIDGLSLGTSIEVVQDSVCISGVLVGYQTTKVLFKELPESETISYYRYELIWLLTHNKVVEIHKGISDLRVYISRVVLIEKDKDYELTY